MSFRPERVPLADLARMRAFVAALMTGAPEAPPPPDLLVRRNGLGPLAYRRGNLQFRDDYAVTAILAERRAAILAEVIHTMARRDIRVAMLKGIAYAGTIYPDPAERPMNDIDLLVPVGQLPDAMRSMADIGFVRGGAPRNLSSYYHEVFFSRGDMLVELHRSIVQRGRTRIPLDEIWQRAALDPRAHGALRLDPVDDFLFCVLHIARSELAVPVLNYVDVARLWPRLDPASRAQFHDRAHDFRVARAVAAVLSMTDLLRTGNPGRPAVPGGRLLPASDDILLASRPRRLPQITQKLVLTEGPREVLGLGFAYARSTFDGWWRRR